MAAEDGKKWDSRVCGNEKYSEKLLQYCVIFCNRNGTKRTGTTKIKGKTRNQELQVWCRKQEVQTPPHPTPSCTILEVTK